MNGAVSERTQRLFAGGAPRGMLGGWPDNSPLVELGPYNNVSGSASIARPAKSSGSPFRENPKKVFKNLFEFLMKPFVVSIISDIAFAANVM